MCFVPDDTTMHHGVVAYLKEWWVQIVILLGGGLLCVAFVLVVAFGMPRVVSCVDTERLSGVPPWT
jgi:hypothetical protein